MSTTIMSSRQQRACEYWTATDGFPDCSQSFTTDLDVLSRATDGFRDCSQSFTTDLDVLSRATDGFRDCSQSFTTDLDVLSIATLLWGLGVALMVEQI